MSNKKISKEAIVAIIAGLFGLGAAMWVGIKVDRIYGRSIAQSQFSKTQC